MRFRFVPKRTKNNNPSKSQHLFILTYLITLLAFVTIREKIMSGRDFDLGLQSAFELLWKVHFSCLKIAQLSFKWADLCSLEDSRLARFNRGELVTFIFNESHFWRKQFESMASTVDSSLHKRLMCLCCYWLNILCSPYCWGLWGENLSGATSVFPHGGVFSLHVVFYPYWVTLYILIAVLCTVPLFELVKVL